MERITFNISIIDTYIIDDADIDVDCGPYNDMLYG